MLDATGYDLTDAMDRLLAERRVAARRMMGDAPGGGFRQIGASLRRNAPAQEDLRARSLAAAALLQEIGEAEEDFDLSARAGDMLY